MSEENSQTLEVKEKVVITPEDVRAALDFWTHFKIPVQSYLTDAAALFEKEQTLENQNAVKLALCKAISETDHEAFKDPIFAPIVSECSDTKFKMQFDKDLEDTLTEDQK